MSDNTPVETPVRYDKKGMCIRHGDLGSVLLEFPHRWRPVLCYHGGKWGTSAEFERELEKETHERGEYVALCINSHASLQQQVEKLEAANAQLEERVRELEAERDEYKARFASLVTDAEREFVDRVNALEERFKRDKYALAWLMPKKLCIQLRDEMMAREDVNNANSEEPNSDTNGGE